MKFKESEISGYVTGYLLADNCWHSVEDIKSALHNSLAMLEDEQDGIEAMVILRAEHAMKESSKRVTKEDK